MALRNNNIAINIDAKAGKAIKELGFLKGALGGVSGGAAIGAIALAGLTAGFVAASKRAMEHAAKLELVQNKSAVVFGGQLPMIQQWSQETANAFGITAINLEGMAAGFADLLIPMGFTRVEAATMTKDVVGLAGAMSEWSAGTRTVEDTTRILARAMLGEREMLKDLGVDIRELDIKQRLMAKGQEELTGNYLKQARAVATMEMIFERSQDAQAGFAQGGESLTRITRQVEAALREMVQEVVLALLPNFKKFMLLVRDEILPVFRDWMPLIVKTITAISDLAIMVSQAGATLLNFGSTITQVVTGQKSFSEATDFNRIKIRELEEANISYMDVAQEMFERIKRGTFNVQGFIFELNNLRISLREQRIEMERQIIEEANKNFINIANDAKKAAEGVDDVADAFKNLTAEQVATKLATDLVQSGFDDLADPGLVENVIQQTIELLKTFKASSEINDLKELLLFGAGFKEAVRKLPKEVEPEGIGDQSGPMQQTGFNVNEVIQAMIPGSQAGFGETLRQALTGSGVISGFGGAQQKKGVAALFEGILGGGTIVGVETMRTMAHTLVTEFAGRQATQQEQAAGLGITINTGVGDPNAIAEEILRVLQLSPLAKSLDPNFIFQGAT